MTVKFNDTEIYKETQSSIPRGTERSKTFFDSFPVGTSLRIDFVDGVRAGIEEIFIKYKNILY